MESDFPHSWIVYDWMQVYSKMMDLPEEAYPDVPIDFRSKSVGYNKQLFCFKTEDDLKVFKGLVFKCK